ncbi:MAG: hypothetical protein CXB60_10215 [Spiroplasma poulsonii]|nr:hypothetical protein [Spiroplasma poulsonii]
MVIVMNYAFNEEIMRSKYEQINYIEKWNMKIIIHYSSWRLNYELPQDKVNEQLRLEQLDIERARVWSWGLPGNTSGSIFARYLDIMQATDIIQPTKLLGGVDLANSTSPKGIQQQRVFEYIIHLIKKPIK